MNDQVYGPVNRAVESAHLLAGLDSCSIWALLSLILVGYIGWDRNKQFKNNEAWRIIREGQIASEATQTKVLERLTEEIVGLKMLITKFLVKE